MTKKIHIMAILFLLLIIAAVCGVKEKSKQTKNYDEQADIIITANYESELDVHNQNPSGTSIGNNTNGQIVSEAYKKNGIEAEYPKLISGGSEEDLKKWNQMIYEDFNKILDIYSFQPFPDLTPVPTGLVPTILTIKYKVKLNNDRFISILYTADYNSPYSAHPTDLVYTTNIDKREKKRLKLLDIVKLNKNFVKEFRNWDYISVEPSNEEVNKAIKDYVDNISDEDLLMGFETADIIGSGNLWGVYSYLTPNRLGISLEVPNYIGDHVEFEREYTKLSDFIKQDIK